MFALILFWLLALSALAIGGWCLYNGEDTKFPRSKWLKAAGGCLVVCSLLFRWAMPVSYNFLVYRGLYAGSGYIFVVILAGGIAALGVWLWNRQRGAGAVMVWIGAVLMLPVGCVLIYSANQTVAAKFYSFEKREKLVRTDPYAIRYTPLEVAHRMMKDTLPYSNYKTEYERVNSVSLGKGTGYRVPVTPDGFWQKYGSKNRGYVQFDDRPDAVKVVTEETQEQEVGEGMEFFDNLERVLYDHDPHCCYRNFYYLTLKDAPEKKTVCVAPKSALRMHLPFIFVEELIGVTLVYDNGKIEELSLDVARERLGDQFIYPSDLTRYMVEVQTFDRGLLSGWYRREGKIKIPKLEGRNQMPFRLKAKDGRWYDVFCVQPDGEANALFRVYYVDILSGERTVLEYGTGDNRIGPLRGIEYVKSVEGFVWYEKDSGTFKIVEPRYLTREGDETLYYMYSVTTRDHTNVVATICIDTVTTRPYIFRGRASLLAWSEGGPYQEPQKVEPLKDDDGKAKAEIIRLRQIAEELSRRLKTLEDGIK